MAKANKLIDVAQAGSAAGATSRPLIVGHGSTIKHDPMVKEEANEAVSAVQEKEEAKPMVTKELKLTPDTDTAVEPTAEAETAQPETAQPDTGVVDSLMNEVDAKQADKKQKKELEAVALEVEKSIESKEFFVPIGLVSRRRSHNRIILSLILLIVLGLAGLNFGIDAEVVDIGVQSLTDIL